MSGATLATGPRVPKVDKSEQHGKKFEERAGDGAGLGGVMGSLRVIELQLVAFIVVFSASGLVPVVDLLFPIFITVYCFLLSYFVFPNYGKPDALQLFKGSRAFQFYVIIGTVIGLFLPLAYVLGGFARGDQESVRAATPHLFLLSFQVLSENIIRGLNIFSLPVRALLPILYNMRRLFTLINWVTTTFFGNKLSPDIPYQDQLWIWFGRGLAAMNAIYYSLNLFGFLIPFFLPRAFEQYFHDRDQHLREHPPKDKKHPKPLPTPASPAAKKAE
jgi:hypothetical protein